MRERLALELTDTACLDNVYRKPRILCGVMVYITNCGTRV